MPEQQLSHNTISTLAQHVGDDHALLVALAQAMLASIEGSLGPLQAAARANNASLIALHAHALKGTCAYAGDAVLLEQLEALGKDQSSATVDTRQVESRLQRLMRDLQQFLGQHRAGQ